MDCFKDWLRSLLSLSGVCVGIFSIVLVLTLIDSLQNTIKEGFESFGTDIVFIEKEPLEPDLNEDGIFRWWEYFSRPNVSYSEYLYLRQNSRFAERMAFSSRFSNITAVCGDWEAIVPAGISDGRAFSCDEIERGASVTIIGESAAKEMFKHGENPIGHSIRLLGKNFTIIGVFEKCGTNTVSTVDIDNARLIPVKTGQSMVDLSKTRTSITVSPKQSISKEKFIEELRALMRQHRRLSPRDKDNFSINRISFIIEQMGEIFALANLLGWIIGLFSLLVGGFGIANIEFVSVQERTSEIGIQKAIGARRSVILRQFIREAAIMSILGGLAGIGLAGVIAAIIPSSFIHLSLSLKNAAIGILVSLITGVLAGLAPALKASRLNPVDAISSH